MILKFKKRDTLESRMEERTHAKNNPRLAVIAARIEKRHATRHFAA